MVLNFWWTSMTKHGCNATEWIATAQFITRKDSEKVFQIRERFRRANESSMCVRQRVELIRWAEQRGRPPSAASGSELCNLVQPSATASCPCRIGELGAERLCAAVSLRRCRRRDTVYVCRWQIWRRKTSYCTSRRPQESSSSVNMPCAVVRRICR